ncbi:pirin domain-containing protein [Pseudohyphozyma bogoriensis]|nr:pirin domain-containing protein [Pseudohyphozyma bogoriensis]
MSDQEDDDAPVASTSAAVVPTTTTNASSPPGKTNLRRSRLPFLEFGTYRSALKDVVHDSRDLGKVLLQWEQMRRDRQADEGELEVLEPKQESAYLRRKREQREKLEGKGKGKAKERSGDEEGSDEADNEGSDSGDGDVDSDDDDDGGNKPPRYTGLRPPTSLLLAQMVRWPLAPTELSPPPLDLPEQLLSLVSSEARRIKKAKGQDRPKRRMKEQLRSAYEPQAPLAKPKRSQCVPPRAKGTRSWARAQSADHSEASSSRRDESEGEQEEGQEEEEEGPEEGQPDEENVAMEELSTGTDSSLFEDSDALSSSLEEEQLDDLRPETRDLLISVSGRLNEVLDGMAKCVPRGPFPSRDYWARKKTYHPSRRVKPGVGWEQVLEIAKLNKSIPSHVTDQLQHRLEAFYGPPAPQAFSEQAPPQAPSTITNLNFPFERPTIIPGYTAPARPPQSPELPQPSVERMDESPPVKKMRPSRQKRRDNAGAYDPQDQRSAKTFGLAPNFSTSWQRHAPQFVDVDFDVDRSRLPRLLLSRQLKAATRPFTSSAVPQAIDMTAAVTGPTLIHRPSHTRGHADHGWLRSYHTFAFGSYYTSEPREQAWGSLRVINEDRVDPKTGFPPHSHREFEIFSYIVDGTIKHSDSMGNVELLRRGDVQMTSAGTGIRHSEYNGGEGSEVSAESMLFINEYTWSDDPLAAVAFAPFQGLHFLQCWALPDVKGLKPQYFTRHYTDAEKTNKLLPIVAPLESENVVEEREGSGPTPIHSPLTLYASILQPGSTVTHKFSADTKRKGLAQLIQRKAGYRPPTVDAPAGSPTITVEVAGKIQVLQEGDGVYLDAMAGQEVTFQSTGGADAEFVFFDLLDTGARASF